MDEFKVHLFSEIRKHSKDVKNLSDEEADQLLFRMPSSMALTYTGFLILKDIFTAYSFEVPENMKTKYLIGMSKMKSPYFHMSKRLIIFSEMDAMVINLTGRIEQFLLNCSE